MLMGAGAGLFRAAHKHPGLQGRVRCAFAPRHSICTLSRCPAAWTWAIAACQMFAFVVLLLPGFMQVGWGLGKKPVPFSHGPPRSQQRWLNVIHGAMVQCLTYMPLSIRFHFSFPSDAVDGCVLHLLPPRGQGHSVRARAPTKPGPVLAARRCQGGLGLRG